MSVADGVAPAHRKKTVTPKQLEANRRNARKCTGPKTVEGKQRSAMNSLKHGLTAETIVLPFEDDISFHEIRAGLIQGYAPATPQELMLVDQIAAGYWRTIRARRFETAMLDNHVRSRKQLHGLNPQPDPAHDDEACAVVLGTEPEESFKNYFRYDASIERQYFRAVEALRKMQNDRIRNTERLQRLAEREREIHRQVIADAGPDTFAEPSPEPPPVTNGFVSSPAWKVSTGAQTTVVLPSNPFYPAQPALRDVPCLDKHKHESITYSPSLVR
jgi:hypothetical protein